MKVSGQGQFHGGEEESLQLWTEWQCQSKYRRTAKGSGLWENQRSGWPGGSLPHLTDTFSSRDVTVIFYKRFFRDLQPSYRYLIMRTLQVHSKVRRHHLLLVYYSLKLWWAPTLGILHTGYTTGTFQSLQNKVLGLLGQEIVTEEGKQGPCPSTLRFNLG